MLLYVKRKACTSIFFTQRYPRLFIFIGLLLTISTCVTYYKIKPYNLRQLTVSAMENQKRLSENNPESYTVPASIRHIHFYNPPGHFTTKKERTFFECPSNCSLSTGNVSNYFDYDVVVFWGPTLADCPLKKRAGQIWVYDEIEPMVYYKHADYLHAWNGLFNWTMSYRRDSDIHEMYGRFKNGPKQPVRMPNIAAKFRSFNSNHSSVSSRKLASTAWFVSHCFSQSKRDNYVKLLNKSHPVDIYGECGPLECLPRYSTKCHNLLRDYYKFYLSFENSFGIDYITEKSLKFYYKNIDAIPITRGFPGMYPLYLPPGSYIDTNRFQDTEELGQFLNKLSQNPTSYKTYFQWRNYYQASIDRFYGWCELCKRLHMPDVNTKYQRVYHDFYNWKFGSANLTTIKTPKDIH